MSAPFESLYPIDAKNARMQQTQYSVFDVVPSYHRAVNFISNGAPSLIVTEYTNWRDEALAAQKTCAIYHGLNPSPIVRITGPDAAKFLKRATVNFIDKFPINSSKHGIMCNSKGNMTANGVLMRIGEDSYEAHWLSPLNTAFELDDYDATLEDLSGKRFIFQLFGPKSLEICEDAAERDFHDLKMCRFTNSEIAGRPVRVLRFGMTGGLAYEVHGAIEDAKVVHQRLIEVGNKYGIRLLGMKAYMLSHSMGGSVQFGIHYWTDLPDEQTAAMAEAAKDDYSSWLGVSSDDEGASEEMAAQYDNAGFLFDGSVGTDMERRFANPFEMGLGRCVDFSHDFVGRDALLAYKENPKRTGVTLKWNEEDILDVYASQLRDEEPYKRFDNCHNNMNLIGHMMQLTADLVVDAEGHEIGVTGGRSESPFHRAVISLASIDLEYADLGTEVYVVWGDQGERQKRIRATVVPTPFNTNYSNRTFNVNEIPRKYA